MSVSGLAFNPLNISCCPAPTRGLEPICGLVSARPCSLSFRRNIGKLKLLSCTKRHYDFHNFPCGRIVKVKSAASASFDDMSEDSTAIFPRIHVKDPYRRLGISSEASQDEIQAARNFLIKKYSAHKPSVDAIESAHDKIIMQKFFERKNPKINLKKKVREVTQSRAIKAVTNRFETPARNVIIKTTVAFLALGILTVLFPTEEGPTLQVAISLIVSIYLIFERLKNRTRALLYGAGAFFGSWLLGTLLMVTVVPPLIQGPRSFEVMTSLITYILLWVSSTFVK